GGGTGSARRPTGGRRAGQACLIGPAVDSVHVGVVRYQPFLILGEFSMKTGSTPKNTEEYIAGFPTDVQRILREIRSIIRTAAPDAEETIKYRMPTFVLHGNLVHFAAFEKHIGFYPTPSGIEAFKDELSAYPN